MEMENPVASQLLGICVIVLLVLSVWSLFYHAVNNAMVNIHIVTQVVKIDGDMIVECKVRGSSGIAIGALCLVPLSECATVYC